jgi:hypothetical protein
MTIDAVMHALERAQAHALPGHQVVERDHVLRELWRLLQPPTPREPTHLRLVS